MLFRVLQQTGKSPLRPVHMVIISHCHSVQIRFSAQNWRISSGVPQTSRPIKPLGTELKPCSMFISLEKAPHSFCFASCIISCLLKIRLSTNDLLANCTSLAKMGTITSLSFRIVGVLQVLTIRPLFFLYTINSSFWAPSDGITRCVND